LGARLASMPADQKVKMLTKMKLWRYHEFIALAIDNDQEIPGLVIKAKDIGMADLEDTSNYVVIFDPDASAEVKEDSTVNTTESPIDVLKAMSTPAFTGTLFGEIPANVKALIESSFKGPMLDNATDPTYQPKDPVSMYDMILGIPGTALQSPNDASVSDDGLMMNPERDSDEMLPSILPTPMTPLPRLTPTSPTPTMPGFFGGPVGSNSNPTDPKFSHTERGSPYVAIPVLQDKRVDADRSEDDAPLQAEAEQTPVQQEVRRGYGMFDLSSL
jgi:hypothetical protein